MRLRSSIRFAGVLATTAALLAAFTGAWSVSADPAPAGAAEFTLWGGKTTDVGTVYVWNDQTNYYVEIDMATGWCMTESHVIAAVAVADIPQANGNPVPGKFPAGDSYNPCADGDDFTFPIAGLGSSPYFAVHVKAWDMTVSTATIVSNAGDLIAHETAYPAAFTTTAPAVVPTFAGWPGIAGASYISNQADGDPFNENHWRKVTDTLVVPADVWLLGGQLMVNSDNYEFTKLNGVEIQRDDDGGTATVEGIGAEPFPRVTPQTWTTIETVPFAPAMGANAFEFVFRNSTWEGCCGFVTNPTGLIYKATASWYAHSESAWAGGTAFPGKNWATYFQYTFQPVLVQTVTVPATAPLGADSAVLANGKSFLFKVSGTVTWTNRGGADLVDAECTSEGGGAWAANAVGYPDDLLELQVNSLDVNWTPVGAANAAGCADGHEYTLPFSGTGAAVNFRIYDGVGGVQLPAWFGDNAGQLTVQIWQTAP